MNLAGDFELTPEVEADIILKNGDIIEFAHVDTKEIIKYEIIEKECVCPNTINDACIEEKDNVTTETNNYKALKMYRKIGFKEDYCYPQAYLIQKKTNNILPKFLNY